MRARTQKPSPNTHHHVCACVLTYPPPRKHLEGERQIERVYNSSTAINVFACTVGLLIREGEGKGNNNGKRQQLLKQNQPFNMVPYTASFKANKFVTNFFTLSFSRPSSSTSPVGSGRTGRPARSRP